MRDIDTITYALGLTLFAGLSTGIGSAIAFFAKKTNTKLLSISLGFSAGVMIYISFMEMLPEAQKLLIEGYGESVGGSYSLMAFFFGMLCIAIIDKLIPNAENPHEVKRLEELGDLEKGSNSADSGRNKKLYRVGIFTAIAVGIHNFPEGFATFMTAVEDPELGIAIAVAIAIHNIPEGIAISIPIFYATGNKRKAFWLSLLSGLSEPVGALIGYMLIYSFVDEHSMSIVTGSLLAAVAGVMIFISFDELLPSAEEYGEHHLSLYGLIAGMAVMAFSLLTV